MALAAEQRLHETNSYGFDTRRASLFSVRIVDGELLDVVHELDSPNVYDLLSGRPAAQVMKANEAVLLATCGWAAPIGEDDDIPPSEHPLRRRVRLMCVADTNGVASVVRFSDKPEEAISDDGRATGSLADALASLREKVINKKGNK